MKLHDIVKLNIDRNEGEIVEISGPSVTVGYRAREHGPIISTIKCHESALVLIREATDSET